MYQEWNSSCVHWNGLRKIQVWKRVTKALYFLTECVTPGRPDGSGSTMESERVLTYMQSTGRHFTKEGDDVLDEQLEEEIEKFVDLKMDQLRAYDAECRIRFP